MNDHWPEDLHTVERSLLERILNLTASAAVPRLDLKVASELFEAQVGSRIIDHTARWLRAEHGAGYYTIGSAGHEANGAVALGLRPTDPALLHYRSGGFYFARASQVADQNPTADVLRGMLALTTDQIAGGRHKVFGSHSLGIIPQTSTIASHLPRAVGLAMSLGRGTIGDEPPWPADSVVVCSFGDASLNHSTAQGALNWSANSAARGERVPILFVCEDNGLGISVPTPADWVESSTRGRPGFVWRTACGDDPAAVLAVTLELADHIRRTGQPGFLHLETVRFLGHAGTDVESAYRSPADLRADADRDPILGTARALVGSGAGDAADLVEWYLDHRLTVRQLALELRDEPELASAEEVMAPLAPRHPERIAARAAEIPPTDKSAVPLTLAQTINDTLAQVLASRPEAIVFGEDVGRKGGVYGVTRGLQQRFGPERVFDTILDEQSVMGLALGAALNGYLPIPEIQYLAYLHNAEDQLRGEAATLPFFSQGQFRNPMVVRIAGYAYQRGFGGHFHNDNSVAVLRDIPGLVIASPSHPSDAGAMLSTCIAAAEVDGSVCVFLEPIARYHTSHLHEDGDGGWTSVSTTQPVPLGSARTHGDGSDGTIITWGNGLYLSLRAQRQLKELQDEDWRVVDLRWLAPLPVADIYREAEATGRVLIVDETRRTGGVGEGVIAALVEAGFRGPIGRIAAEDSFVPLGEAANLVLVSEQQIVDRVMSSRDRPNII